ASEPLSDYIGDSDSFSYDSDADAGVRTVEDLPLVDGIRYWALSNNATHRSIDMVLKLFRKAGVRVPVTTKTLLQTRQNPSTEIAQLAGGQNLDPPAVGQFTLTLSVDGLPLHRSGSCQFWPVLFSVDELPAAPVMTAAIYCGLKKPNSVEQYLRPVVTELNELIRNGLQIKGKLITCKLRVIVADTPARSFVKDVIGHTSYGSCLKCTVQGHHSTTARTMVFPYSNAPKRTDRGFRDDVPGHRKTATPLLDCAGFDMIEDVPVADRLHLLDLGNVRRLMMGCRDGTLGEPKSNERKRHSFSLALQQTAQPCEVHRKIRHLK
uniref:Uncharacterized protein n=1 Tax=Anopheles funestus TaxID=62324 RepID=A0A182RCZ6_ANOFN